MDNCESCGNALGSNAECKECLEFLVQQGKDSVDEESARRAESDAKKWLINRGKSAPKKLFLAVELLASMIRDSFSGEYKEVPWTTMAMIAFATIYVINPFDLIPDFIPVVGWTDDISVVLLVFAAIGHDLEKYCISKGRNPEDYGL